jgi:hypothetical protein
MASPQQERATEHFKEALSEISKEPGATVHYPGTLTGAPAPEENRMPLAELRSQLEEKEAAGESTGHYATTATRDESGGEKQRSTPSDVKLDDMTDAVASDGEAAAAFLSAHVDAEK